MRVCSVPVKAWLTREYYRRIDSFVRHRFFARLLYGDRKSLNVTAWIGKELKARMKLARLSLPMRCDEIADFLGLKTETISRDLASLRKLGILGLPNSGEITIRDLDRLEALIPAVVESKK